MKKGIKITLILFILLCTTYVFVSTSFTLFPEDKIPQADSVIIQTHWKQMGGFELSTPDHLRLGCWSTALAQIMYYHHLKPYGHVAYVSSKGYHIDQDIDSSSISFNMLSHQVDTTTPKSNIRELAKYNYYAALAVRKDFGTDNYMQKLASANLLERHYKVNVSRYISWKHILPYTTGKLEKIICKEISQKRPLFLHFTNLKNFGHSVVIDGYSIKNKSFMVHLNQGQGGPQDGWYDFNKDILRAGDNSLRVIYTFNPHN